MLLICLLANLQVIVFLTMMKLGELISRSPTTPKKQKRRYVMFEFYNLIYKGIVPQFHLF